MRLQPMTRLVCCPRLRFCVAPLVLTMLQWTSSTAVFATLTCTKSEASGIKMSFIPWFLATRLLASCLQLAHGYQPKPHACSLLRNCQLGAVSHAPENCLALPCCKQVTKFKKGDRVGVGCLVDSCRMSACVALCLLQQQCVTHATKNYPDVAFGLAQASAQSASRAWSSTARTARPPTTAAWRVMM